MPVCTYPLSWFHGSEPGRSCCPPGWLVCVAATPWGGGGAERCDGNFACQSRRRPGYTHHTAEWTGPAEKHTHTQHQAINKWTAQRNQTSGSRGRSSDRWTGVLCQSAGTHYIRPSSLHQQTGDLSPHSTVKHLPVRALLFRTLATGDISAVAGLPAVRF